MSLGGSSDAPATEIHGEILHSFDEAGDAEPMTPLGLSTSSVALQTPESNSGTVYVGGSEDLDGVNGFILTPGSGLTFDLDLSSAPIYGYAEEQGDEVRMIATD